MNKQVHSINIIYEGNFEELLDHLVRCGVYFEFVPPGLVNSESVLILETGEDIDE